MARFIPDIKTNQWVIIAPSRLSRPHDNTPFSTLESGFKAQPVATCPFCPGSENQNKELFRIGGQEGDSNWKIRVIANKFPICDYHEVIIHSQDHEKGVVELPLDQVELILQVYRQRFLYHHNEGHGQVMIFNNHDVHAGASIKHPHSQVVVVPNQVTLDSIPREPFTNMVTETDHFVAYCPEFSQWPYEIWLAPKVEDQKFFGEISDDEISDLARLLQKTLRFIVEKFEQSGAMKQPGSDHDVPFNYYIYHGQNWYIRIIPRLIHRAGFELGTGLSVNVIDPVVAAQEYKEGLNNSK